jgi:metal-responsive CopG/Arc/MetJ family transcriptional regulator
MPRKPVTVSLPAELVREAGTYCRKRSVTMSEIVRDAMRDYLHRQRLETLRRDFTEHLQKQGVLTEQELVRRLQRR